MAESLDTPDFAPPKPLFFTDQVVLAPEEATALCAVASALLDGTPPFALCRAALDNAPLVIDRARALDCAATLLDAADQAAAAGEWVKSFALLGMEGRLLEELAVAGAKEHP